MSRSLALKKGGFKTKLLLAVLRVQSMQTCDLWLSCLVVVRKRVIGSSDHRKTGLADKFH